MAHPYAEIHTAATRLEVYISDMVYAIQDAEAGDGSDADIRTMAEAIEAKAQEMLKMAKAIYPD